MKIFRTLEEVPAFRHAVLTIGTFDGVHKGHQKIIEHINRMASDRGGESVILSFHPHPRMLVNPQDTSLKLITTLEEKLGLLERYGVDNVVVVPFTRQFSQLSAEAYIHDFLVGHFHPELVVIGYDHRFGNNRVGDINMLHEAAKEGAFEVFEIKQQVVDDIAVSSTKIRHALDRGDITTATHLLGHSFSLQGFVVKGKQLGRQLGFPTANIHIDDIHQLIPADGVYAVRCTWKEKQYPAVMNIGKRPTVNGEQRTQEVYIFDFNHDIYGEEIRVNFVERIRNEQKFNGIDALKAQIAADVVEARRILG